MRANSVPFSSVASAQEKFVLLGPPGQLFHRIIHLVRSLQESEHIAVDECVEREPVTSSSDLAALTVVRRWFWGRKRDRGFLLTAFPANLGQALVFDEWLDARDESLSACLWVRQSYAGAIAEAERCHICPADGFVGYADASGLSLAPRCAFCGQLMESCAEAARQAVVLWHKTVGPDEAEIARHYADRGLLRRLHASSVQPAEPALS